MNAPEKLPASPEPHVMNTYGRLPIALSHGQGCWLWDTEGKKYLDALAGIAVNTLGHDHPKLVPALQDQVAKLIHSSNYYHVPRPGAAGRQAVRAVGPDQRLLLQLRPARPTRRRSSSRASSATTRASSARRSWSTRTAFHGRSHRHPVGHRQRQGAGRLRPAGRGLRPRAAQRHRRRSSRSPQRNTNVVAVFLETIQGEGGINPMRWRLPAARCASSATSATGC